MKKSLKEVISKYNNIHFFSLEKPNKIDRKTWKFTITDKTSEYAGLSGCMSEYNYQIVTLRRDNYFFLAYKMYIDDIPEYYVDVRKSNFRRNATAYINSLMDYSVFSNDISKTKNESSFRITEKEMKSKNIDNYLDLCFYYGDYSAIGTGYTRNIRNLVVFDIDVDCTKKENVIEINNLLLKFAKCNALPDFYIFNKESKHVQLQWLIKRFNYKIIDENVVNETINEINHDTDQNKEINYICTDFTKLTDFGIDYRRYTLALTDIVKKYKFGDKHYTYWKAKNFYTALLGKYELELKMPYIDCGEIKYYSQEEMLDLFSTKEKRKLYLEEAPTIIELYKKTDTIIKDLIGKVTVKKVSKIKDDEQPVLEHKNIESNQGNYGKSRNTFVLICSRTTTWEVLRNYGYRETSDINKLSKEELNKIKNTIYNLVKNKFKKEDKKYNHIWPDTTNMSNYSNEEFEKTFNTSFRYAIQHFKNTSYNNEQRKSSLETRHLKKDLHLSLVDYIRQNNKNIKRNDLFTEVNELLEKFNEKKISLSSLKQYISESKRLSDSDRINLHSEIINGLNSRNQQLSNAIDKNNEKTINICKKRCNYLNVNIINTVIQS